MFDPNTDDWEPAVAADPSAPYVYILSTHFAAKPCSGNCPTPWMSLRISSNGGSTFGTARPLCACKGSWQYDPIIEVVKNTGAVYATYLNGFNTVFMKSTNHGQTWSTPVPVYGNVSWTDKPALTASADGRDVYISFNGPNGGDPWMAVSHDFGATWTQTKVDDSTRYYFAYDADGPAQRDDRLQREQHRLLGPGRLGGRRRRAPRVRVLEQRRLVDERARRHRPDR